MSLSRSIDRPQCPICFDPFTAEDELCAPKRCGHVFCKPCADQHFAFTPRTPRIPCPVCREPISRDRIITLYMDYGSYHTNELGPKIINDDFDASEIPLTPLVLTDDAVVEQGVRATSGLVALSSSEPACWGSDTQEGGSDEVFTRTGRFLEIVAAILGGDDVMKGLLRNLGAALVDFQKTYHKIVSLAQTLTTIQSQLATAKSQLKEQARAHTKELTQREVSVRQVAEEAQEREKELHRKLQRVKEDETAERQGRREAEEEVAKRGEEIEKWMTTATRYKKRCYVLEGKVALLTATRKVNAATRQVQLPGSDDSLEIEGEGGIEEDVDIEIDPPPSSDPTASQDPSAPSGSQPSAQHEPARDNERGHLRHTARHNVSVGMKHLSQAPAGKALSRTKPCSAAGGSVVRIPTMPLPSRNQQAAWNPEKSPKKKQRIDVWEIRV